jgi:hypothetical protein
MFFLARNFSRVSWIFSICLISQDSSIVSESLSNPTSVAKSSKIFAGIQFIFFQQKSLRFCNDFSIALFSGSDSLNASESFPQSSLISWILNHSFSMLHK